jgi:hypothetical protein
LLAHKSASPFIKQLPAGWAYAYYVTIA